MGGAIARANERANREAKGDVGNAAWQWSTYGEAGSSKSGKLGGPKGTRWPNREGAEQRWEGSERRGSEGRPVTLPLNEFAVFRQPFLNARVQDDEVVIEGYGMAACMGCTLSEEASKVVKGGSRGEGQRRVRRHVRLAGGIVGRTGKENGRETASNIGSNRPWDVNGAVNGAASGEQARTALEECVGGAAQPVITFSGGGCVGREKATHNRVNKQARVGTVSKDMGGQLTRGGMVDVAADVTEHACPIALAATLVANGPSVMDSHVQGVGSHEAKSGVRVGGCADGSADG